MTDYEKGVNDCRDGKPHQMGMGDEYNNGYSDQYYREQLEGAGNAN
jgi:hypothetical protein